MSVLSVLSVLSVMSVTFSDNPIQRYPLQGRCEWSGRIIEECQAFLMWTLRALLRRLLRRCRPRRLFHRFHPRHRDSNTSTSSTHYFKSTCNREQPHSTTPPTGASHSRLPFTHPFSRAPTRWLMPLRPVSPGSRWCLVDTLPHAT
jgi:hypothetical protein